MEDNSFITFDNFDNFFPTTDINYSLLSVVNPFETYDDKKFRERFQLSKSVIKWLLHLFRSQGRLE